MVTDRLAIRKTLSEAHPRAMLIEIKKKSASTTSATESLAVNSHKHKMHICGYPIST